MSKISSTSPSEAASPTRLSLARERALVIAEIAQAHDGSLGTAHAYIDVVAQAGADVVKFQTHIASAESTPSEPWRVRFSKQDETRYNYWQRMEFTPEQWGGLKEHAESKGLIFLSSPFSLEAVDLLKRIGVSGWKIASGELQNTLMLSAISESRLPVILSTGMSSFAEIDDAVSRLGYSKRDLAIMQCTSAYPTPPGEIGLNVLSLLRERYGCAVGLSDHSGTIFPGIAAVTLGAKLVEVHVTFSRDCFGPDVCASLTPNELKTLVEGVRFVEEALSSPVDKDSWASKHDTLRETFGRSIVAKTEIAEGTILERKHVALKKPGIGLPPSQLDSLLGSEARQSLRSGHFFSETDLRAKGR